jgi:hypothetical protein
MSSISRYGCFAPRCRERNVYSEFRLAQRWDTHREVVHFATQVVVGLGGGDVGGVFLSCEILEGGGGLDDTATTKTTTPPARFQNTQPMY